MSSQSPRPISPCIPNYSLTIHQEGSENTPGIVWVSCDSQGERDVFSEIVTPVLSEMCSIKNVNKTENSKFCIVATINSESMKAGKRAEDITTIFHDQFAPQVNITGFEISYRYLAERYIENVENVTFFDKLPSFTYTKGDNGWNFITSSNKEYIEIILLLRHHLNNLATVTGLFSIRQISVQAVESVPDSVVQQILDSLDIPQDFAKKCNLVFSPEEKKSY